MSLRPFSDLVVSTQTVMAYANCRFNLVNIFKNLPVIENVDNTLQVVHGPVQGGIYQLKCAGKTRGIPSKKGVFRNQITACIFVVDKLVTTKIFPTGKFHMTGCKNLRHQQGAIVELIKHIRAIHTEEEPCITIEGSEGAAGTNAEQVQIILDTVMVNVDFHLGYDIDLQKMDESLQTEESLDFYTIFETPVNTSVNIKMDYPEPKECKFNRITMNFSGTKKAPVVSFDTTSSCPKAKVRTTRTHTFLVFGSSQVIQSGRFYETEMEPAYIKFNQMMEKHRKNFQLKLQDTKFDMSKLEGLRGRTDTAAGMLASLTSGPLKIDLSRFFPLKAQAQLLKDKEAQSKAESTAN